MEIKKQLITALKGFGMGAGSVTPCVSAGTVALLTGIYQPLLDSLASLSDPKTWKALFGGRFKEFWKLIGGTFLVWLAIGFVISILALAKIVSWGLEVHPIQTWAFFFGLIVASTVLLLLEIRNWKLTDILFMAAGIGLGIGIFCLTPSSTPDSLLFIFICGAVSVCSMILPGIAGSFVLQVMGKYEYIMKALNFDNFNIPVIAVFCLGCVVGLLAFSKFLKWLMSRWEKSTLLVLIGFVMGSLVRIWPYSNMQSIESAQLLRTGSATPLDLQIPSAILWCAAGIAVIAVLQAIKVLTSRK